MSTTTTEPTFPVHCRHGKHVGWAYRTAPTVIVSRRMAAPCRPCFNECERCASELDRFGQCGNCASDAAAYADTERAHRAYRPIA